MTRNRMFLLAGLVVTLLLAGVLSFYASSSPDGLEKVAEDKGFNAGEKEHPLADSPLADYSTKGVDDDRLSGGLAGIAGVGLTLATGGALFLLLRRRGDAGSDPDPDPDGGGGAGRDEASGADDASADALAAASPPRERGGAPAGPGS